MGPPRDHHRPTGAALPVREPDGAGAGTPAVRQFDDTPLATGGSATATGQRMVLHPNTVRHRLRRIAAHTGRNLDQPTALAELSTAVHALRLLPGVR